MEEDYIVNFQACTDTEFEAIEKDDDTLYFVAKPNEAVGTLYKGDKIFGTGRTSDFFLRKDSLDYEEYFNRDTGEIHFGTLQQLEQWMQDNCLIYKYRGVDEDGAPTDKYDFTNLKDAIHSLNLSFGNIQNLNTDRWVPFDTGDNNEILYDADGKPIPLYSNYYIKRIAFNKETLSWDTEIANLERDVEKFDFLKKYASLINMSKEAEDGSSSEEVLSFATKDDLEAFVQENNDGNFHLAFVDTNSESEPNIDLYVIFDGEIYKITDNEKIEKIEEELETKANKSDLGNLDKLSVLTSDQIDKLLAASSGLDNYYTKNEIDNKKYVEENNFGNIVFAKNDDGNDVTLMYLYEQMQELKALIEEVQINSGEPSDSNVKIWIQPVTKGTFEEEDR